jgi:hypothetical protein
VCRGYLEDKTVQPTLKWITENVRPRKVRRQPGSAGLYAAYAGLAEATQQRHVRRNAVNRRIRIVYWLHICNLIFRG